ncbi:hypothetical protein AB1Y20_018908 [Prymnesium parvum]|uniref:Kinesin motor domain-containing protein n=1 Tax=Prymnesium parvum TaxID=97485 RepID=A0AB34JSP8_PRYPA
MMSDDLTHPPFRGYDTIAAGSNLVESDPRSDQDSFLDTIILILAHCDWKTRACAPAVSKAWRDALHPNGSSYWLWLCERLKEERLLYVPDGPCPSAAGWKEHFLRLWKRRNVWSPTHESEPAPAETFSIGVSVRFRPAVETAGGDAAKNEGDSVVMPLHQRVAVVRAKQGCSKAEALQVVMRQEAAARERGGRVQGNSWDGCVVAAEKPSETVLEARRLKQEAAAKAMLAAEDENAEKARRTAMLKPYLNGPSRRALSHEMAAASVGEGLHTKGDSEGAPHGSIVHLQSPLAATAEEVMHFFDEHNIAPARGLLAIHLIPSQQESSGCQVFVDFEEAVTADEAASRIVGRQFNGCDVQVARVDAAAYLQAIQANPSTSRVTAADSEAQRRAAVEVARAERAATLARRQQDAAALKAYKEETDPTSDVPREGARPERDDEARAMNTYKQKQSDTKAAIIAVQPDKAKVLAMAPGAGLRPFTFEHVFDADASQQHVYELCGRPAVADLLNGQSGCVLVYGQTGAGKTHTMFGDEPDDVRLPRTRIGIVPRVCEELLAAVDARRAFGIDGQLRIAYVEVFGAEVTDLLKDGATIGSTARAEGGHVDNSFHAHRWVLEGRADVPIDSIGAALELVWRGDACKRRAATAMNERSSRAHTLFIITLVQTKDGIERTDRLFLADLGGSEKLTKSQAADEFKSLVITQGGDEVSRISWAEYYQHRSRLQESLNINIGLFALQRCIDALLQRDGARAEGKQTHVPFGDSKLTLLLKDALNGGARTTVLVCASLEPRNATESIQSLRFGEACSRIEMRAGKQTSGAMALRKLVAELDEEIAATQAIIVRDQRWEVRRTKVRHDTVELKDNFSASKTSEDVEDYTAGVMVVKEDDGLGAKDTVAHEVVGDVLVGAEEAEAKLEILLARRRELLGEL